MTMHAHDYYLDWCPRPTHSVEPRVYGESGGPTLLKDAIKFAGRHGLSAAVVTNYVEQFVLAYRTDGIFVFAIQWKEEAPATITELNIAGMISHFIKFRLGHVHTHDGDKSCVIRTGEWKPFHKYPIKLSSTELDEAVNVEEEITPQLERLIGSDEGLVGLNSDYYPIIKKSSERPEFSMCALLRLREKYSRLFDRSQVWIKSVKGTTYLGIPIYKRALLYFITYFAFVTSWTIHDLNPAASENIYLTGVAGEICALSFIVVIESARFVGRFLKLPTERLSRLLQRFVTPEAYMAFSGSKLRWLPSKHDIYFFLLLSGPLLFSIREAPNALEILKFFKINWLDETLAWTYATSRKSSFATAFAQENFFRDVLGNFLLFFPLILLSYLFLDVSVKRRRVIRTLTRLKGHLHYGNILNAVIDSAFYRSNNRTAKYYGFDEAILILIDQIKLERKKRTQVLALLAIGAGISTLVWWEKYLAYATSLFP